MVFWEKLYYRFIKNRPGFNLRKRFYLYKLRYYSIRIKGIRAYGKGPRNLEIY